MEKPCKEVKLSMVRTVIAATPVSTPFSKIRYPKLSVPQAPLITAVKGLSPVKSKVVTNVGLVKSTVAGAFSQIHADVDDGPA